MIKLILPFLFCMLLGSVSSAQCNSSTVRNQIMTYGAAFISNGYQLTHDLNCGGLYDGRYQNYYYGFRQGWSYSIFAVCDGDCGDIDLFLYDENGNLIDSDEESDDYPVVEVTPRWSGRFRVKVTMYDCDYNPCYYGVAVMGR